MRYKILLVDDDAAVRKPVRKYLEKTGFEVCEADSAGGGAAAFRRERPDAVLLDFALPDGDALELLPQLKTAAPHVPVFILTGHGSIERAVQSVKEGAEDFLTKPIELAELADTLHRTLRKQRIDAGTEEAIIAVPPVDPFLGDSNTIRELAREAHLAVRTDSPVLITGATGAGKGVLARWLHEHGTRAEGPFVALNCGGLSKELLESELFGHARGAFTGAVRDKEGLIPSANGGSLFLDEIGDMDPDVQPKLLTVLEERRFRRLGGLREHQVDLRLIAATNRDLADLVGQERFRTDLYFRIGSIVLNVPSLHERRQDLPELVQSVLATLAPQLGLQHVQVTPAAQTLLSEQPWPGNFRQLRGCLERALLACKGSRIEPEDLRLDAGLKLNAELNEQQPLAQYERQHIVDALTEERGHMTRTAARLGIARSTLYEKIKTLAIDPAQFR